MKSLILLVVLSILQVNLYQTVKKAAVTSKNKVQALKTKVQFQQKQKNMNMNVKAKKVEQKQKLRKVVLQTEESTSDPTENKESTSTEQTSADNTQQSTDATPKEDTPAPKEDETPKDDTTPPKQEEEQDLCKPIANPPDVMNQIVKNEIVLAKMDVAISLSSNQQMKKILNKEDKIGVHCLCDFTIIRKIGDSVTETDCPALPDTLEFIKDGQMKIETCQLFCMDFFNEKLGCNAILTC